MNLLDIYNKVAFWKKPAATVQERAYGSPTQLYHRRYNLRQFMQALQAAESFPSPDRLELYNIYNEIDMDAHLTSVVQSRRIMAIAHPYQLVGAKDTKSAKARAEAAMQYLSGQWFQDTLTYMWDTITYGHSLIEIEGINKDRKVTGVSLIPRQNVSPERGLIVKFAGASDGIDFNDESEKFLVPVGKKRDLGLYAKAAKYVLMKDRALLAEGQYVDMFGQPLRVARINTQDPARMRAMDKALAEMPSAGYITIDKTLEEEIELLEAKSAGVATHQPHIQYLDSSISKLIFGQTMMTENGSSRSQAEVHERLADEYSKMDRAMLESYVNDILIPKLIALGVPLDGLRFEFIEPEDNSELFTQTLELLKAGKEVDDKFIFEKFAIPTKVATDTTDGTVPVEPS